MKSTSRTSLFIPIFLLVQMNQFISLTNAFVFSFYNNELFINIEEQISDRGYQLIWGFIQLQHYAKDKNLQLPNVLANFDNINTDQIDGKKFAFWREFGDTKTILWPEHDYWGWQSSWQAPYPMYVDALQSEYEYIPWKQRKNAIYWSGAILSDIRGAYHECAKENGKKIVSQAIVWRDLRSLRRDGPFSNKTDYKPMFMDARKKLHYKFAMYLWGLQWSSSLKRIIAAGSVVIIPTPNPHETVVTQLLAKHCADCYLTIQTQQPEVNATHFCESLKAIIRHHSKDTQESKAKDMGSKLAKFAKEQLSLENTLEYMYTTLVDYATSQKSRVKQYDDNIVKDIKRYGLIKYDCQVLKRYHLSHTLRPEDDRIRWQYDEWYDSNCRLRNSSSYLHFTAM